MRKSVILAVSAAAIVAAGGGGYAMWTASSAYRAKEAVLAKLRDPASAVFTGVESCANPYGDTFVTGYVNSRNGFNAMSGNQRFFVSLWGDEPYAEIASDDPERPNLPTLYEAALNDPSLKDKSCLKLREVAEAGEQAEIAKINERLESDARMREMADKAVEEASAAVR